MWAGWTLTEQNAASTSIATQIERIANMVEESDHAVREASSSVAALSVMATDINRALGRFRLS